MADTVQVMMERMIPELEDLQEKCLFSADEIRQIVDKRRSFEYTLKRQPMRKMDGLRYIEYELNLDALRLKRKERLHIKKSSLSDIAGIKRIRSIFDRILHKHIDAIDIWLQYIAFCKHEGSSKVLSHVFSRALQAHPRSEELWIEAASVEFSMNLNISTARVLLQRAIRINRESKKLWLEYFRLECLYVQKLDLRRKILQLEDNETPNHMKENKDSEDHVLIDQLQEEKEQDANHDIEFTPDKVHARKQILAGAIPRIIFENAVTKIPNDVNFQLEFIPICDLFGKRLHALANGLLDSILQAFPNNEQVHAVNAKRPILSAKLSGLSNDEQAFQDTIARWQQSVTSVPTITMKELFIQWLVDELKDRDDISSALVDMTKTLLKEYTEKEDSIYLDVMYVDILHRTEGIQTALIVAKKFAEESCNFSNGNLWLLYAQLTAHAASVNPEANLASKQSSSPSGKRKRQKSPTTSGITSAITILRQGLSTIENLCKTQQLSSNSFDIAKLAIWTRLLEILLMDPQESTKTIEKSYHKALNAFENGSLPYSTVRLMYLRWAFTVCSVTKLRKIIQTFLENGRLLPTTETYHFLLLCIEMELANRTLPTSSNTSSKDTIMSIKLFEKLVSLYGAEKEDVWVKYIAYYTSQDNFTQATKIHHRAKQYWKNSTKFDITNICN